jgi:hypothetical protein
MNLQQLAGWFFRRSPRRRSPLRLSCERLEDRLTPDATYFSLATAAFKQDWNSTGLITAKNDWSSVPSIIGYSGAGLAPQAGTDPHNVLTDGTKSHATVLANQIDPSSVASGGVAEFDALPDATVALKGDHINSAPNLVLYLDSTGLSNVQVSFTLRSLGDIFDNAVQPVSVQYRVGATGNFTSVTEIANASTGVQPVDLTLPSACGNQAQLQIRILTTYASGLSAWIGVDNLRVSADNNSGSSGLGLSLTVDSTQSSLTVGGSLSGGTLSGTVTQQGTGSLTTSYTGTIAGVLDQTGNTLQFSSSTALSANTSGSWQPDVNGVSGMSSADYGGQMNLMAPFVGSVGTLEMAVRDLAISLSSSALALTGSGSTLSFPSTQTLSITAGNVDYLATGLAASQVTPGRASLAALSATNTATSTGSLQDLGGGQFQVTLPISVALSFVVSGQTITFNVSGQIVASGSGSTLVPPVANSDFYETSAGGTLNVPGGTGVLSNDTNSVTSTLVDNASNGNVALAADGSFTYAPNPGFQGVDTFTYKASGPGGDSSLTTATITVDPASPPQAGVFVTGGTLRIVGADTADQIQISTGKGSALVVQGTLNSVPLNQSFSPAAGFKAFAEVLITGLGGDDNISISPKVKQPIGITEGDGNNTIVTGKGSDRIIVGNGNNNISSGAGNDSITAGNGNDSITAGSGNNDVTVGTGQSQVSVLGSGHNVLISLGGTSTLQGGSGKDLLITEGNDVLEGGKGSDILIHGTIPQSIIPTGVFDKILAGWKPSSLASYKAISLRLSPLVDPAAGAATLDGQAGTDWFWTVNPYDTTDRQQGTEHLNAVT